MKKILFAFIPFKKLRRRVRAKVLGLKNDKSNISIPSITKNKNFQNIKFSKNVGNLITIKSFWSSGGSAVNDLLLEFENVVGFKQQEFMIIETIDGLMDLEYRFVNNRSSVPKGLQMSRFQRLVEYLSTYGQYSFPYDNEFFFDGYFRYRSMKFINEIILEEKEAALELEWHLKFEDKDFKRRYKEEPFEKFKEAKSLAKKYPYQYGKKLKPISHYFPREKYYITKGEEVFENAVTNYVNDLINFLLGRKDIKGKNIVLDQMLNIDSYNKYKNRIKNLKYILVDRDPRDVFILNREKLKSLIVPKNSEDFVIWYKSMRAGLTTELKKEILYVKFEDLIYNYEKEVSRIMRYLDLNHADHIRKFQEFNPEVSIKNTQMFLAKDIKKKYSKDIKIIEGGLKEYLYNFPGTKIKNLGDIF